MPTTNPRVSWAVTHEEGDPAALLGVGGPPADGRSVRFCHARSAALVLGSTQSGDDVDADAAARAGLVVVRRHSGGGAVLVEPGALVWADVGLPRSDPLWDDDVGRAFWWLGQAWADALAGLRVPGAEVHRGAMVTSRWSAMVCFAGLGPGEVTVRGRKVVGMAQRRTRQGALFQCAVPLVWRPERLLEVLALGEEARAAAGEELARAAGSVEMGAADLAEALVRALPQRESLPPR